jgi:hypothetical protein
VGWSRELVVATLGPVSIGWGHGMQLIILYYCSRNRIFKAYMLSFDPEKSDIVTGCLQEPGNVALPLQ